MKANTYHYWLLYLVMVNSITFDTYLIITEQENTSELCEECNV